MVLPREGGIFRQIGEPVRPRAETAAAAIAAFRKLRREIMFMVFIAVAPSLERAACKIKTRSTCGTGFCSQYNKTTLSLCVHPQGQSREIRICGATLLALPVFPRKLQSPSRRANTPLPCNGGFRPKLLRHFCLFARPSAAHESLPRSRPFSLSGLTEDALCRFSSASLV